MKSIIGLVLMLVWMALFILGAAEPTGEYEVSTPTWIGWAYVMALVLIPFISINLIANDKN